MCLDDPYTNEWVMRFWFSLFVRKGHQPRQPVRRGIQHPNFTELVIYNSASFLSVLIRRFGRALPPRRAWTQISRFRDGVIIAYFSGVVNQPVVYFGIDLCGLVAIPLKVPCNGF